MQPSTSNNFFSSSELNRIGKFTGFVSDSGYPACRDYSRLCSQGLVCDKVDGIAGLHRHFNAFAAP